MKHFYLLFIFYYAFLFTNIIRAQAPAIQWQKCLGGSVTDVARSITSTTDGGSIVVGYSFSNDGDVTGNHGDYDYWVVKLSSTGGIEWQRNFGGSYTNMPGSVKQTADGGFIIAGYTGSTNGDVSGNHGLSDYWILKLDKNGNIIWRKCYGGSSEDEAYAIQQTNDGGYIVAGSTRSNDGDVTGPFSNQDAWIVKLDNSGTITWQKRFGGSNSDYAKSIEQTTDGGYIVAGYTASNDSGITNHSTNGNGDYWVFKLNSSGGLQWQKNFGGSSNDEASSIKPTSDGGYIVCGTASSADFDVTGLHGNSNDFWILKLNTFGGVLWQKCLGGTGQDDPFCLQINTDGDYVVVGSTWSTGGDILGNHGTKDAWVACIGKTGSLIWQKCLGGTNWEQANSIDITPDGGYIIAGYANSYDGDVIGLHGSISQSDFWVVKLLNGPCTPTINITTPSPSICSGAPTFFTVLSTNGGSTPIYQWKVNGISTGTNTNTFKSSIINNNDVITCDLTSNATCATIPTVTSNAIKMIVNPSPVVSISGDTCVGGVLTANSNLPPSNLVWTLSGTTKVSTQTAGFQTNAVTVAGGNGSGVNNNQLNSPTHFFIDVSGTMYIPDMNNNRIQKWIKGASFGTTVAGGNGTGSANNQLNRPTSVSMDSKGNLYITDQNNNRLHKWAPGALSGVNFGAFLSTPTDVFIDAGDNVYVSQQGSNLITRFPSGSTRGVTVAGGNGYGTNANQLGAPTGIFVDANGNIYICDTDNDRVQKWSPGATSGITVAGGNGHGSGANQLANPLGIFVDNDGNMYIADYNNARVQKWAAGSTSGTTVVGGLGAGSNQLNHPESVFIDANGDLFIADLTNNRVQKFLNALTKTYTTLTPGDYSSTITSSNGCTATSNSITVVVSKTPSVTITSDATAICPGVTVTFTASPVDGGSNPTYQWKINGSNAASSTNTSIYQTSSLKAGDVVSCVMTSNATYCLNTKTAISNLITMTSASAGVASVTITASDTVICAGSTVKFTAVPANGGLTPKYDWKINGITQGTNTSTFSTAALLNGDVISCVLTSGANLCPASLTATSNAITIKSIPVPVASVSIVANDTLICTGSRVNFTANSINGGSNPIYQWQVNGANASANSSVYASSSLKNNDVISCNLTNNMQCASSPVQSNKITMTVDDVPLIKMRNDTTIFLGSSIKLNTLVTGNVSSYTWAPSSTLNNSAIISPTATPNITTTYKLLVTTPGDCKANGAVTIITITQVDVPNAFSPNGDGINDVWRIAGLSSYAGCTVEVFNRYGQIVFHSKGYNTPWDGTFKGHYIPVGTYYYIITIDKTTGQKIGSVTVLQ